MHPYPASSPSFQFELTDIIHHHKPAINKISNHPRPHNAKLAHHTSHSPLDLMPVAQARLSATQASTDSKLFSYKCRPSSNKITAQSQHGCGTEAINLFEKMKRVGEMPTHVTFIGVLAACSHVGMVNEGLGYFESMIKEHGLVPKPEHYVCVVDLLSRAGFLSRTRKFIEEMAIKPDAMVWRTLLSACTFHKNIEIGEYAAHHLLELEPEDSATYVLLSNLYAIAGKWNYRDQTRKLMKDRGVKKEPGRSWIEVKNSVHAFYVGDQLHPLAHKIFDFLADLNKRAAEIGYTQDRYSLFNDLEQEQKDPTVYIHSEKLAIAFGLLSSSHTVPIRIMKNLRVCKDCHTWTKFVSKISNREIVVRDAYRFHHFAGGVCSCGDYW